MFYENLVLSNELMNYNREGSGKLTFRALAFVIRSDSGLTLETLAFPDLSRL